MGFAMSKPDLRAGLETDLVEICEGRKSKDVVLQVGQMIEGRGSATCNNHPRNS